MPKETGQVGRVNSWWVAVVAGMASYIDSATIVSSGTALVIYQHTIGVTPGQVGLLSSALTLAVAVGALFGGRLGDAFGRRRVFLSTMVVIAIGSALLVLGSSFAWLALGTLLLGVGTGADLPVSLATIAEAAKDQDRGSKVSFSQVLWTAGILASTGLGALVGDLGRVGGQILYGHIGIMALAVMVTRLSIPESTDWKTAQLAKQAGVRAKGQTAHLRDLFDKRYLLPFIALLVFYPLTNLAANTLGQFNTYLFVNTAGTSVSVASTINLGLNVLGVILVFLFMRVVDGPHRMRWFAVGAIAGILAFSLPAFSGLTLSTLIVAILVFQFTNAFAFEPIMKVWAQESFPTLVRTTAQGTVIAVARALAAGLGSVTPLIVEAGSQYLFAFLAVVMAIGMAVAYIVFMRRGRNEFLEQRVTT